VGGREKGGSEKGGRKDKRRERECGNGGVRERERSIYIILSIY
jgi:hypothetical protein